MDKIAILCIVLILIAGLSLATFPAFGYTEKYTHTYPVFSRADIPVTVSASDPTRQAAYDRLMKERWQQIGENLLLEASLAGEPVTTWSDIEKASFLYTCYMKSLHEAGAPVNHDQITRKKGGLSSGASDDYACGWHEVALSGIFEGAGITTGVPVVAGYWGTDLFPLTHLQPNNNHGVISLYDPDNRRIVTFDPLQDGMQNGDSYDVGEESRFNGLDSDEWEEETEKWGFTKYSINGGADWYSTLQEQDILNEYKTRYSREKKTHDSSSDDTAKGPGETLPLQDDKAALQPADSSSGSESPSPATGDEEIPDSREEEAGEPGEPGEPSEENTLNGIPLSEWQDPDNHALDMTRYTKPEGSSGVDGVSSPDSGDESTEQENHDGEPETGTRSDESEELNTVETETLHLTQPAELSSLEQEDTDSVMSAEENAGSLFGPASSLSTASPAPTEKPPSGGEGNDLIPPVCTLLLTPDGSDHAYAYQVNNGEVTIDVDEIVPARTDSFFECDSYRFQSAFRGTIRGNRIEGSDHFSYITKCRGTWGSDPLCTIVNSVDQSFSAVAILSPDGTYQWYGTPTGGQTTSRLMDDCAAGFNGGEERTKVSLNDQPMEYTGTWSLRE